MVDILTAFQGFTLIILFFVLLYVSIQKASKLQTILILLVVSTFIMMGGYMLEITASTAESAYYGTVVSYIGKPMTVLFSLLFILHFCGYKVPRWLNTLLVVVHAFFSFLVAVNPYHHLFYSYVEYDRSRAFSPLVLGHGPFYYIYMSMIVAHMFIDFELVIHEFRKTDRSTKSGRNYLVQVSFILAMALSGIIGLLVFMTGITKGYDTTMLGCFIGTILLIILFARYRIFDVLTKAKDDALQHADSGLLVLDSQEKPVYINDKADELLKDGVTVKDLNSASGSSNIIGSNDRFYRIKTNDISKDGRFYGRSIEISDITDSYLYSSRLEKDVEERTRQIKHMQRSIIGSFANMVEARDDTTGYHIKRTSSYVRILAEEMKKAGSPEIPNDEFINRLEDAAPMHDIGKISIPDAILNKPGKLDPYEFSIIKTHTTIGADIIEKAMRGVESDEYVTLAKEVALSHHEKWDGSGYPYGLKGREIPVAARIMAVADVYDALRSERPYKKPFSKAEASRIIIESSGTHFDPAVVAAFIKNSDKFGEISEKMGSEQLMY